MPRRRRLPIYRADAHALPPGTLMPPKDAIPSKLSVFCYGPEELFEAESVAVAELSKLREQYPVCWINLAGLQDVELIAQLGEIFGLHRLALEDTVSIPQRPKHDAYTDHHYITARMPVLSDAKLSEQLSIFLGDGFVLTVQEFEGDVFDGIRKRLRDGRPRLRTGTTGYLAYAILDALVDAYFPVIESFAVQLDELELRILSDAPDPKIGELHDLKRSLISLRRYLDPLRELIGGLLRGEYDLMDEQTKVHLRDCYDHCKHAYDLVESYRDVASGVMDLQLSVQGQRMNEVMKVLTVIATLFIPLSFIAGVYGMNFDASRSGWNMPELGWSFGYPYALGLMAAAAGAMLLYFRRKGWFR